MNLSTAAIAASGTATLETALMGLPTLLVYRVNRLTYWLSKVLVHIDSIGLPNIIMGHRVIPELWQDEVTPENIAAAMVPMTTNRPSRITAVSTESYYLQEKSRLRSRRNL